MRAANLGSLGAVAVAVVVCLQGCGDVGRLADLHAFDTATREWRQLPTCDAITGRGGAGFAASPDGEALFVVGGFSGKEMNDVFRYVRVQTCCAAACAPVCSPALGKRGGDGGSSASRGGGGDGVCVCMCVCVCVCVCATLCVTVCVCR